MIQLLPAKIDELDTIFDIYLQAKKALEEVDIFQWTNQYPNTTIIQEDIEKGYLYLLKEGETIVGAINISDEQEAEYATVPWEFDDTKVLVVHRLVVHPDHQRKGHASRLMDFAEGYAKNKNYTSIRLDTYSQNEGSQLLYKNRDYHLRGTIYFPGRVHHFLCLEKKISDP